MSVPLLDARRAASAMARYRKDYRAFAREQLKLDGRPFDFWPCQMPLVEAIERQMDRDGLVRQVWLKARQVGMSTLAQTFVAWRTMLWPHVNAIVIADQAERSRTLFDISRSFYESMGEEVRPVGRYVTKRELVFANPSQVTRLSDPGLRSRIVVDSAHKSNIAIGARWDVAHLSEAARFPKPELVIDGVIPAVHRVPGTMIIIESSAEKAGTWYRDFCDEAMRGQNAFEFHFVPWYLQPEYYICPVCGTAWPRSCGNRSHESEAASLMELSGDERHIMAEFGLKPGHIRWMREKLTEMAGDWDLFRQSFPLTPDDAWVTAGAQVFPAKKLREQKQLIRPPIRLAEIYPGPRIFDKPGGRLWLWKEPEAGKAYDIGVDVAMGSGRDDASDDEHVDYSVACVLERGTNDQVAEWASRAVDPFELATVLYWLGKYYNTAQLAIETNSIGGGTNQQVSKLGYPNIYIWRYRDEIVPRYSKKTGWESNLKSKPWLVGFAAHEMANDRVLVRSELLLKELEVYVQTDARQWGAVAGHHDDRVVAWMIALLTSDDENFMRYYGLRKTAEGQTPLGGATSPPRPWECDGLFLKPKAEREGEPWD